MRLTRIFVDSPLAPDADLRLPDAAANHVGRVLRLRAGAAIVAFDGSGNDYRCEILSIRGDEVRVRVGPRSSGLPESPLRITLVQAVSRGERMDWTLQKATELGVRTIVPVLSARSVVRLDDSQAEKKLRHWQAIVAGACEQCGRSVVPEIRQPQELSQYLAGQGFFRDVTWYVDQLCAQVYAGYILPSRAAATCARTSPRKRTRCSTRAGCSASTACRRARDAPGSRPSTGRRSC